MIEGFQYEFLESMKMGWRRWLRVIVWVSGSIWVAGDVSDVSAKNSLAGGGEVRLSRFHVNVVGWVSCTGGGRWSSSSW